MFKVLLFRLTKKPSVYEWVSEKLMELGLYDVAVKALTVEKHMKEIYGNTITKKWVEDFKKIQEDYESKGLVEKLNLLSTVASNSKYCIACEKSIICDLCKYGEKFKECKWDFSERGSFCEILGDYVNYAERGELRHEIYWDKDRTELICKRWLHPKLDECRIEWIFKFTVDSFAKLFSEEVKEDQVVYSLDGEWTVGELRKCVLDRGYVIFNDDVTVQPPLLIEKR